MKHIIFILLAMLTFLPAEAQKAKTIARKKAKTSASAKSKKKKTTSKKKTAEYNTPSIKGLKNKRADVQKKIKEQERLLRANKADVKKRLGDLMTINGEINQRKQSITNIQNDISHLDGNIVMLRNQLSTLQAQLEERKAKYAKSMQYLAGNRTIQDKLMFIFSAKNMAQMYRRLRFVREYATYQRAQGEIVKAKQAQINAKNEELNKVRGSKNMLLNKSRQEHAALQGQQAEQQKVVNSLQKQQKTIQAVIAEQRKKDAELNAQIDRLVAEEVAKAKARAEAEARRKAAAAEAAAKKRAEELARKKAAAEAAARENERRIAAAREREARLKAEAKAAEAKSAAERERAEREAREAESNRIAAERKARVEAERHKTELDKAKKESSEATSVASEDRALNGSFERNRGRLPMPLAGACKVVSHFGRYNVEGLKNVTLDNKGVNLKGAPGATVRSVFDGEVSAVSNVGGSKIVMVRHGLYISVYCNLGSTCVYRGQKVSARQALGTLGTDAVLQFQLRKGTAKLNPEQWLGR